jgi:hypothetical protein
MQLPRLPLPGPADVVGGAASLRDGFVAALDLVPRMCEAMTRLEALLGHVERTMASTDALVERAETVVAQSESLAASAGQVVTRSNRTLDIAEITNRDAGRAVEGASGLLQRTDALLSTWEPVSRRLAPAAEKFAEALDPAEVQAAISLVDRMPLVLDHLENDVLPMLTQLDRVGPDVHELLEVVEDLRRVVTGLPGVGLLRRRGVTEQPPEIDGSVHESDTAASR